MKNWPALVLAPSIALTNLSINYALVSPECARQSAMALHAVALASLVLNVIFSFSAWKNWRRRHAASSAHALDDAVTGNVFVSMVAFMVSSLSSLVIIALWLPQWVLSPCSMQ